MADLNEIRDRWSSKRCPFGVSEYCITSDCGAWNEGTTDDRSEFVRKEVSYDRPGFFSTGWKYVQYDTHEIGSIDYETGKDDRETVGRYRWEREHYRTIRGTSFGYCIRLKSA